MSKTGSVFILTLHDNEKHFCIVLHGFLRRVFCLPCRVLVGRSGRARGVYQRRKEEKADGETETRRQSWGELPQGTSQNKVIHDAKETSPWSPP